MACLSVFFLLVGVLLNILYASGACYHHYKKCVGLVIAGGCLLGLSLVSGIITIVIFRRLKQKFDWENSYGKYLRFRNMPQWVPTQQVQQLPHYQAYRPPAPSSRPQPRN